LSNLKTDFGIEGGPRAAPHGVRRQKSDSERDAALHGAQLANTLPSAGWLRNFHFIPAAAARAGESFSLEMLGRHADRYRKTAGAAQEIDITAAHHTRQQGVDGRQFVNGDDLFENEP